MLNLIFKKQIYQKFKEFKSFLLLLFLLITSVIIISIYDKFKFEQSKNLENLFQNIYLKKTLLSISSSLEPRFQTINHIVRPGESFEEVLKLNDFDKKEKKKNYRFNH